SPAMNTQPLASSGARQYGIQRLGIGGRKLYSWGFRRGKMRRATLARRAAATLAAVAVVCASAQSVRAADEHLRIAKGNVGGYKALLPAPVYERVRAGDYVLNVVPVDPQRFRANYTDRFWKASAANRGKYGIDAETGGLTDAATGKIPERFFGLPFPEVQ